MSTQEKVNILLVDDQPAKLLSYEVILNDLGENLIKASSGREALTHLLKSDIAVVLMDVCMPDLDGFQLAAMIREHPRFQRTAMIFISAILLSDLDRLRGYEMGAVDYVPVPVIPEVLRAKVRIFVELYRKTRELERMNAELEERVRARTAELEASTAQLRRSEEGRSLALVAGNMGSWDWSCKTGDCVWDNGQYQIFGVDEKSFAVTPENVRVMIHPDDWDKLQSGLERLLHERKPSQSEFRIKRPNGEIRWCIGTAAPSLDADGQVIRVSGVTLDITDRKLAEERQALLAREVDHRAKNVLALVQSIIRLTRSDDISSYVSSVEGRIRALSRVHAVLSLSRWQGAEIRGLVEEEFAPFCINGQQQIVADGPDVSLQPAAAQSLALALHEMVTNAAKYGALSSRSGGVKLVWELTPDTLELHWSESGGPPVEEPTTRGVGTRIITASIEGQLSGRTCFDWNPAGLHCVLSMPRGDMSHAPGKRQPAAPVNPASGGEPSRIIIDGKHVMIVEDEAVVAMALRASLDELGFSVIGPFSKVSDAMIALRTNSVDAAVLDVNLGTEVVYPLADVLTANRLPFIFVTGYGPQELERRFAEVPVLQKPIELDALRKTIVRGADDLPLKDVG